MSEQNAASSEPLEEASGLLPVDPPVRGAVWTGWLMLALAITAVIFSITFRFPETITAPFVFVPTDGEDPVQAPIAGELAAINVREGGAIRAGEELFRLRSDGIREARARLAQLTEDCRALTERARRLDESHVAELAIKDAEIVQAKRELGFRDQHLETIRDIVRRSEQLAAAGSVSPVELLGHKLSEAESLKNRVVAEKVGEQLVFQRQQMSAARARRCSDEQAEAEKLRVQVAVLQEQLQDTQGDLKLVRAPYDAVVLRLAQRTPGGVVGAGAELCHLARVGAHPRARLIVPEAGVPRMAVGQKVRLFVDSYPHQRHGTFEAEVAWVSPSAVNVGNERRFVALADLPALPAAPIALRIGMSGEARILVGRQTLLEQALEPLRAMQERLR